MQTRDVDELLAIYGIDVNKALDPLDPSDFVTLVQRFGNRLRMTARPFEVDAVDAALSAMDVDWKSMSSRQTEAALKAANTAIAELSQVVPPRVRGEVITAGRDLVGATKTSAARRYQLGIETSFTEANETTVQRVALNQGNFVTDYYGVRAFEVEEVARGVVANSLEQGLGVDEISKRLEQTVKAKVLGRSPSYWNVVANSFMNRARTDTHLRSFREAGIERWRFEAVLDQQTTDQCRMLHDKVFAVGDAIARMESTDVADDPVSALKNGEPWLLNGKDENGNPVLYTKDTEGNRTIIANVLESAVGKADTIGRYQQLVSDRALMERGIPMPPLHGRCRSTIVPEG